MSEQKDGIVKTTLAVIGLITVVVKSVEFFNKRIRKPLEEIITDAFDKEERRAAPPTPPQPPYEPPPI